MLDVRHDKVNLPTAGGISQFVTLFTKLYLTERSRDRFPVVSLDISVTYFLPIAPWPWGRLSP